MHQLVNKQIFDNIKMHGSNVKKNSYNIYLLILSQSVSEQDSYKIVQLELLFVH